MTDMRRLRSRSRSLSRLCREGKKVRSEDRPVWLGVYEGFRSTWHVVRLPLLVDFR